MASLLILGSDGNAIPLAMTVDDGRLIETQEPRIQAERAAPGAPALVRGWRSGDGAPTTRTLPSTWRLACAARPMRRSTRNDAHRLLTVGSRDPNAVACWPSDCRRSSSSPRSQGHSSRHRSPSPVWRPRRVSGARRSSTKGPSIRSSSRSWTLRRASRSLRGAHPVCRRDPAGPRLRRGPPRRTRAGARVGHPARRAGRVRGPAGGRYLSLNVSPALILAGGRAALDPGRSDPAGSSWRSPTRHHRRLRGAPVGVRGARLGPPPGVDDCRCRRRELQPPCRAPATVREGRHRPRARRERRPHPAGADRGAPPLRAGPRLSRRRRGGSKPRRSGQSSRSSRSSSARGTSSAGPPRPRPGRFPRLSP